MTRPFYPQKSEIRMLLDGRMTAIVRPIKNQPEGRGLRYVFRFDGKYGYEDWHGYPYDCPFGSEGAILWCKERWWSDWQDESETELCYAHEQA